MRFSIDWVEDAQTAIAEERATLCDLRILVDDKNVSAFYDPNEKTGYEGILVPAVLFAEGIATDWWKIFGARDIEHRVLAWRQGFVLPDLHFEFDGSKLAVTCKPLETTNPQRLFWQGAQEYLTRGQAESVLSEFVEQVIDRLHASGVSNSDVEFAWTKVRESRGDEEEQSFCEAAGALGVDPYAVNDADASFIEQSGILFEGEALIEFLAGIRQAFDSRTELPGTSSTRRHRHHDRQRSLPPSFVAAARHGYGIKDENDHDGGDE